jgi:hypothetical protein
MQSTSPVKSYSHVIHVHEEDALIAQEEAELAELEAELLREEELERAHKALVSSEQADEEATLAAEEAALEAEERAFELQLAGNVTHRSADARQGAHQMPNAGSIEGTYEQENRSDIANEIAASRASNRLPVPSRLPPPKAETGFESPAGTGAPGRSTDELLLDVSYVVAAERAQHSGMASARMTPLRQQQAAAALAAELARQIAVAREQEEAAALAAELAEVEAEEAALNALESAERAAAERAIAERAAASLAALERSAAASAAAHTMQRDAAAAAAGCVCSHSCGAHEAILAILSP